MSPVTPDPRRWWALALLCAAFFMVILDANIVIVALPSIEADLGFSEQGLQWVISAYALTFAGLLLLGGRAADLLGRRRLFMVGLVLFTLASLVCGLAWSPGALIGARAFQGIGAAIMTPTALSIISTTFEEGTERNKALAIWGMLGAFGATAGLPDRGPARRRPRLGVALLHQRPRRHWSRSRSAPCSCARAGRRLRGEATTPPGALYDPVMPLDPARLCSRRSARCRWGSAADDPQSLRGGAAKRACPAEWLHSRP